MPIDAAGNESLFGVKTALSFRLIWTKIRKDANSRWIDKNSVLVVDGAILDGVVQHWLVLVDLVTQDFALISPLEVCKVDVAIGCAVVYLLALNSCV